MGKFAFAFNRYKYVLCLQSLKWTDFEPVIMFDFYG